jgi:hypothetical protein
MQLHRGLVIQPPYNEVLPGLLIWTAATVEVVIRTIRITRPHCIYPISKATNPKQQTSFFICSVHRIVGSLWANIKVITERFNHITPLSTVEV